MTANALVRGDRIVLEDHLMSPALPTPVRYARGVDLVLLSRIAGSHDQVPDMFEAYNCLVPPVSLPDFLGALSSLIALEMLTFA